MRADYERMLSEGVAREMARLVLPSAQYSRMWAKANLLNWLKFLTLRLHTKAQWEIRQYAIEVARVLRGRFPLTWGLFEERVLSRDGYEEF